MEKTYEITLGHFSWARENTEPWGNGKVTLASYTTGHGAIDTEDGELRVVAIRPGEKRAADEIAKIEITDAVLVNSEAGTMQHIPISMVRLAL